MSTIGVLRGMSLGLGLLVAASGTVLAASSGQDGDPGVFRRSQPAGIGTWRQHYDQEQYHRYRGDPGAQFQLRQKRQNLCRNVPEMC